MHTYCVGRLRVQVIFVKMGNLGGGYSLMGTESQVGQMKALSGWTAVTAVLNATESGQNGKFYVVHIFLQ